MARDALAELVERSADPGAVRTALGRLDPAAVERLAASCGSAGGGGRDRSGDSNRGHDGDRDGDGDGGRPAGRPDGPIRAATHPGTRPTGGTRESADGDTPAAHAVRVVAASRSLTRLLENDPDAFDTLADLGLRAPPPAVDDGVEALVTWKDREILRIAARDLAGIDGVEATTGALADLAADVLRVAVAHVDAEGLAVVGMGKLGGHELNYGSDIDLLFVGGEVRQARAVMDLARRCYRVDANLRPEGRDGPLTRSLDGYATYWERWAEPWEFQALLKAVPVAGDPALCRAWAERASAALWGRPFGADEVRSLRALKARSEAKLSRREQDLDVKHGRGGIRDIEFSVQLLQLVHGRVDPELRSPTTLVALGDLAAGGYVDPADAEGLATAYRFLRRVEHVLQLEDDQQTHAVPADRERRRRVARVLGYRGRPDAGPTAAFDADLARHRRDVRSAHERLYFRPLLVALAGAGALAPEAAAAALGSFGFGDAERTRQAVRELTRGLTRSSRMMQQLLPLLLDWLSEAPDPDGGLLGLRKLASGTQRTMGLANAFRDRPDVARNLCQALGTSPLFGEWLGTDPDLIVRLADPARLRTLARDELVASSGRALAWRAGGLHDHTDHQRALHRWRDRHLVGVAARDVFGVADVASVGADLTVLAEAVLERAVATLAPRLPFAVVALGRFAGEELSYASDLDVVFVHEATSPAEQAEALRVAGGVLRFVGGATPAQRIYVVDAGLRPEGRDGPLSRTLDGYAAYFARWAQVWERQAMARARPVAGDRELGERFAEVVGRAVWEAPFTGADEREVRRLKARVERERIPPGEDREFHLKLGPGALADVEWTVQLLQLRTGTRAPGTAAALAALEAGEALSAADAEALRAAYRLCEATRNRWYLVGAAPAAVDALPTHREDLERLARSLGTTPAGLREDYRRVTRRCRRVVERVFYGAS